MPRPARRSRRARNEPPEIVPPKSDEEQEDDDNDKHEEGEDDVEDHGKDDEEDSEEDKTEKSDDENPAHPRSKQGTSFKPNQKAAVAEAAEISRRSKRSRKPSARAAQAASDTAKGRRRRRASNSSDDQRSKGNDGASSGEGSEGGGEDEVTKQQEENTAKLTPSKGRPQKSKPARHVPSAKADDEGSKDDALSSDSEDGEGDTGKQVTGNESDDSIGSKDKRTNDEAEQDDGDDSSDNEPLSVMLKRKKEALVKKQRGGKSSSPTRLNDGDDQSELESPKKPRSATGDDQSDPERPKKPLSAAATSGDDGEGDEDQISDAGSSKKQINSRAKRGRKAQPTRRGGGTRLSGDEGDTDEPPKKRTKRRGGAAKGVWNQTIDKETPYASTNDEGGSDEGAKGEKHARGRRRKSPISKIKEQDTAIAGSNDEESSNESVKEEKPPRGRRRKSFLGKSKELDTAVAGTNDEASSDESVKEEKRPRGRPRKSVVSKSNEQDTSVAGTNDEGSSDESVKEEKLPRGRPRTPVFSKIKELETAVAGTNDEASSDESGEEEKWAHGRPRKSAIGISKEQDTIVLGTNDEGSSDESINKKKRGRGRSRKAATTSQSKDKVTPASPTNDEGSSDESAKETKRRRGRPRKVTRHRITEKNAVAASTNDERSADESVDGDMWDREGSRKASSNQGRGQNSTDEAQTIGEDESQTDDKEGTGEENEPATTRQVRSRFNSTADEIGSGEENPTDEGSNLRSRRSCRTRRKPYKLGGEDSADDGNEATKTERPEAEESADQGGGRGRKRRLDAIPSSNERSTEESPPTQKRGKDQASKTNDVEMNIKQKIEKDGNGETSDRDVTDSAAADSKTGLPKRRGDEEVVEGVRRDDDRSGVPGAATASDAVDKKGPSQETSNTVKREAVEHEDLDAAVALTEGGADCDVEMDNGDSDEKTEPVPNEEKQDSDEKTEPVANEEKQDSDKHTEHVPNAEKQDSDEMTVPLPNEAKPDSKSVKEEDKNSGAVDEEEPRGTAAEKSSDVERQAAIACNFASTSTAPVAEACQVKDVETSGNGEFTDGKAAKTQLRGVANESANVQVPNVKNVTNDDQPNPDTVNEASKLEAPPVKDGGPGESSAKPMPSAQEGPMTKYPSTAGLSPASDEKSLAVDTISESKDDFQVESETVQHPIAPEATLDGEVIEGNTSVESGIVNEIRPAKPSSKTSDSTEDAKLMQPSLHTRDHKNASESEAGPSAEQGIYHRTEAMTAAAIVPHETSFESPEKGSTSEPGMPAISTAKMDKDNDEDQFHDAHMELPSEPPSSVTPNNDAPSGSTKSPVGGNSEQTMTVMEERTGNIQSNPTMGDLSVKPTTKEDLTLKPLANPKGPTQESLQENIVEIAGDKAFGGKPSTAGFSHQSGIPDASVVLESSGAILELAMPESTIATASLTSKETDYIDRTEASSQSDKVSEANRAAKRSTDKMEDDFMEGPKEESSAETSNVITTIPPGIAEKVEIKAAKEFKPCDLRVSTSTMHNTTVSNALDESELLTAPTEAGKIETRTNSNIEQAQQSLHPIAAEILDDAIDSIGLDAEKKDSSAHVDSLSVEKKHRNAISMGELGTTLDKTNNSKPTSEQVAKSDRTLAKDHSAPNAVFTDKESIQETGLVNRKEQNDNTPSTLIESRHNPPQPPPSSGTKTPGTSGLAGASEKQNARNLPVQASVQASLRHGDRVTSSKSPTSVKSASDLFSIPVDIGYIVKFGPSIPPEPRPSNGAVASSMDFVDEDKLKRVKTILYAAGNKTHRGHGFERIFAEYWDAMALRLSDRLSSHTSERCQRAIDNFLNTAKLRKLHNKFILSIMRRATRSVAAYDEISVHLPMKWRKRVGAIVAHPSISNREAKQDAELSLRKPVIFSAAGSFYREAWDQHLPDPKPLANERRRQKTLLAPKSEIASSNIPGALAVDPVVRKIAQQSEMQVSELAVWLMAIAVKEHSTNILRAAVLQKETIDQGEVAPSLLKFPKVLASPVKVATKKDTSQDPLKSVPVEKGTKTSRKLTALDVYAGSGMMPFGSVGSVGGSMSRNVLERSLHVSYDYLPVVPNSDFMHVQHFITDQIFAEARTRTVPPKTRDDERDSRPPENNIDSNERSLGQHNSFAVPPPAPAPARKVEPPAVPVPQVQQRPAVITQVAVTAQVAPARQAATTQQVSNSSNGPTTSEDAEKALPRGMGRGAKNLAALMQQTSSSTPPVVQDNASKEDDTKKVGAEANDSNEVPNPKPISESSAPDGPAPNEGPEANEETEDGGQRRGKGFGIKNLAAMRARASNKD